MSKPAWSESKSSSLVWGGPPTLKKSSYVDILLPITAAAKKLRNSPWRARRIKGSIGSMGNTSRLQYLYSDTSILKGSRITPTTRSDIGQGSTQSRTRGNANRVGKVASRTIGQVHFQRDNFLRLSATQRCGFLGLSRTGSGNEPMN